MRWDRTYGQLILVKRTTVKILFKGRDKDDFQELRARHRERRNHTTTEPLARLHVHEKGLYSVTFEELFSRPRPFDATSLALTGLGEPVAFHVEPDPNIFQRGSVLYFLSDGAELNPYGTEAVYELAIEPGAGRPMNIVSAAPSGLPVDFYWERLEQEEDYFFQSSLVDAHDPWLWKFLFAPDTRFFDLPVDALAPSPEPAKLELWLQGGSDLPGNPDHHVRALVNGTFLGEVYWSGTKPQKLDLELWPGVLVEGNNVLELENVGDTFAAYSVVFVDRLALTYPRLAHARGGMLAGTVPYAGTLDVSSAGDAFFFDTTTDVPDLLSHVEGATFRVEAGRSYAVVDRTAAVQPLVTTAAPYVLKRETNQADYILLGPQELLDVAQPLLDHRAAQGLLTWAVPIDTVFEEFGFGEARPEAIKDFLSYAYHHWSAPAPRYVVLLGDGTWDFHDAFGTGASNQVPPLMQKTRYIWASSDSAYAAVNGDDILPDLAIGRLPASSVDEAHVMVQKILDYENGNANFFRNVVLVADNADMAGDFEADADWLASTTLAGREVDKLYLSQLGAAATRDAVLQSFDDGASIVSYLGHGSINLWADETIFHNNDLPLLAPQSQQPFVLTMNCLNGFFTLPFFDALAEKLVTAEGRGAIATFSPSGLSLNEPAKLFHEAMLEALTSGEHLRLGDAVLAAQEAYAETRAFPELLAIYHLFGDPALLMR